MSLVSTYKSQNGVLGKPADVKPKNLEYWSKEVTSKPKDLRNLVFKPIYHVINWAKLFNPSIGQSWLNLAASTKDVKNALSAAEIPPSAYAFGANVWELIAGTSKESAGKQVEKTVLAGAGLVNPVCELTFFAASRKVILLSARAMARASAINALALFFISVSNLQKVTNSVSSSQQQIATLSKRARLNTDKIDLEKQKIILARMGQGKWISYFTLSTVSLASFAGFISTAPWVFLALTTSALSCNIGAFFHSRRYDIKA